MNSQQPRRHFLVTAAKFAGSLPLLLAGGPNCGAAPIAPSAVAAHASVYNVRDYCARGDGRTVDSSAINAAIHAAAEAGGGTVCVPPGVYLCASIRLQSHITLHLEAGAVIVIKPIPVMLMFSRSRVGENCRLREHNDLRLLLGGQFRYRHLDGRQLQA